MGDKKDEDNITVGEDIERKEKKYRVQLEESLDRERRMLKHYDWRGGKYPPFSIEHMPYERQRLSGSGMTAEDRMLRKQWFQDQILSPNEPVEIAELTHRNPIRKLYKNPMDSIENMLSKTMGNRSAFMARWYFPKVVAGLLFTWYTWYTFKYNEATWEREGGWTIYGTFKRILPGDPGWSQGYKKDPVEFADRYFSKRSVFGGKGPCT